MNRNGKLLAGVFSMLVLASAASAQPAQTNRATPPEPAAGAAPGNQPADTISRLEGNRKAELLRLEGANQAADAAAPAAPVGTRERAEAPPNAGAAGGNLSGNSGMDAVKSQLHATDAEWKIIEPILQSVITARQTANEGLNGAQANMGFAGMMGGRGGPGGGFGPGGGDSFADPGAGGGFGRGGPGGFGGGDRGGFGGGRGGFGGGGPGGGFGRGGPGGFGGDRGGFGGGGFPGIGGGDNAVALAMTELKTALSQTNTPPDQIAEKVAAVRSARQKAKAGLAAAEKNLRELLTAGQETVLVSLGYLE